MLDSQSQPHEYEPQHDYKLDDREKQNDQGLISLGRLLKN